jgi:CRISPR/Cas system CMR-associated protein Cmr3 (group 5 of RAMP superfamily)
MSYFQHLWLNFKKTIIQKMSIVCKLPIQELLLLKLFVHLPIVKKHNKILSILGRRLYLCSNINASKVYQLKKILKKKKESEIVIQKEIAVENERNDIVAAVVMDPGEEIKKSFGEIETSTISALTREMKFEHLVE